MRAYPPPPPNHGGPHPPPPLGRRRHTPGQRDAGRLLPCALPRESVSGNFSRRHVLGAFNNNNNNNLCTGQWEGVPTPVYLYTGQWKGVPTPV